MKEPKISQDGCCPSCTSSDWKLAKMLVLGGIANINTKSSGGGFGASAGSGGVGVNYQGIDLSTTGVQTVAMVDEYAPPMQPKEYINKDSLIKECADSLKGAAQTILNIDKFAQNMESIKPGFFSSSSSDSALLFDVDNYKKASKKLLAFQKYELDKAIWDRTRVCSRCGDSFITPEDKQFFTSNLKVPEYSFVGMDRRCPHCQSYQWKTSLAYYSIPVLQLEKEIQTSKVLLDAALNYASKPKEKGFWGWMARPLFPPLAPDDAKQRLEDNEARLKVALKDREQAFLDHVNFSILRICSECKTHYTLEELLSEKS